MQFLYYNDSGQLKHITSDKHPHLFSTPQQTTAQQTTPQQTTPQQTTPQQTTQQQTTDNKQQTIVNRKLPI